MSHNHDQTAVDPFCEDCRVRLRKKLVRHNHSTRDIRPQGECPACDEYWEYAKAALRQDPTWYAKRHAPIIEEVVDPYGRI